MARCFLIAQSQNQAVHILGMLRNAGLEKYSGSEGFDGMIVSTPRNLVRSKTCSYSVEFSPVFRQKVAEILKNNNMKNDIVCI